MTDPDRQERDAIDELVAYADCTRRAQRKAERRVEKLEVTIREAWRYLDNSHLDATAASEAAHGVLDAALAESGEPRSRDQLIADFWRETSGYPTMPLPDGSRTPRVPSAEPGEKASAVIEPLVRLVNELVEESLTEHKAGIRAMVDRLERSERRLRDSREREVILEEALRQAYDAAEYMSWDLPAAIAAKKEEQDG